MDGWEQMDNFVDLVHRMLAAQWQAREQSHPVYGVTAQQLEEEVRARIFDWEVGRNVNKTEVRGEVSEGDRW